MARPREKLKIPDRSSRIVEIGDIEKKLANYGRAFLNDLGKNAFESDAELSKFIGCSSRDCKTMREYFLNEVQFTTCKENIEKIHLNHLSDVLETVKEFKKFHKTTMNKSINVCPVTEKTEDEDIGNSIILSISVFKTKSIKKVQEYLVLSNQYLTDLKDSLLCQSDYICLDDHSENPGRTDSRITKDVHKSGFFFINNVFYNDMRDPSNIEYSKEIFDWISKQDKKDVEPFRYYTTSRMEGIRFSDLKLRLGYPYIYMHQFNCEHIISFEDLRCVQGGDLQARICYPRITYLAKTNQKMCNICAVYPARWMTRKDMLAFTDPSYFCDRCFDYLHYDENHKKVAEFKAYPFRKC